VARSPTGPGSWICMNRISTARYVYIRFHGAMDACLQVLEMIFNVDNAMTSISFEMNR
jgi:hypothetical protein